MSGQLSPLLIAESYRLLAQARGQALDALDGRLEELGIDRQWLEVTSDRYERLWLQDVDEVAQEHGFLPVWLLVVGSDALGPRDFLGDLDEKLAYRCADAGRDRPLSARPVLHGWVLGRAAAPDLPTLSLPAVSANDADVHAAFVGLAEHVCALYKPDSVGPELACNAVVWRVAGVLEALGTGNIQASSELALRSISGWITDRQRKAFEAVLRDFGDARNALTHVREAGGFAFRDVLERYQPHDLVETLTALATLAVFRRVKDEQLDMPASGVAWCLGWIDYDLDTAA